jgi:histidine triad (HIT) family protein
MGEDDEYCVAAVDGTPGKALCSRSSPTNATLERSNMSSECVFCRIAARRINAYVVHEDDRLVAFLDRGPIRIGHIQIVPRDHFPYFDEAPAEIVCAIALLGQRIALALKKLYGVPRVAFLFTGGDIPHLHAHVVPMHEKTDITSRRYIAEDHVTFRAIPEVAASELARTADEVRHALKGVG